MENLVKGKKMLSLMISISTVADVIGIISDIITVIMAVSYVLEDKNKHQKSNRTDQS